MYTFPSRKKIATWPIIRIEGDPNRFPIWLSENPDIDRRVPPVYLEFLVDAGEYTIAVHYSDSLTGFDFRLWYKDKNLMVGYVDYERINGTTVHVAAQTSQSAADTYTEEWLEQTSLATALTVLGAQAYMLYFKPEITEQIYTPQASSRPSSPGKRITQQPIRIRKHRIKRITMSSSDKPRKDIEYRKLAWHVRGHYRHVGKDKHLVYIQPHTSTRGGKRYKTTSQHYEIVDDATPRKELKS